MDSHVITELNESRKSRFGGHIETTTVRPPGYVLVVCAERQGRVSTSITGSYQPASYTKATDP